jgi:tetratricopeptide (TPR) repeat protein
MMSRIVTSKSFLVAAIVLFVVAAVCTQIPLLNYLGYEFSFLMALIAGFVCGLLGISLWREDTPKSDAQFWEYVRTASSASLLVILVPFLIITTNAFFVKNCSFTQGFRLYLLYVVPSAMFCGSLGTLSSIIARKHKKTLFIIVFLTVLAQIPYVTLSKPQIFAFNPIAGYFPGFTYDESLGGEMRLLVYRVSTLAASALILTVSVIIHRFRAKDFRKSGSRAYAVRYGALVILCLVLCVGLYRISDTIGLSSSEGYITRQLGGVQYTTHFKIVYPRKSVNASRLQQIAVLHEYLFAQLSHEWQIHPRGPITVFIYQSPQQKERLIGAAGTDFTKPWLRQVNINLGDVEGVLKHELVHAMLAGQGIPFLQVAPNSGLIEGAAVATERFEYDESLHRLAAEIVALGIHPNVADMFSVSGFFKAYPGVSYVLAGSFCRYLMDRYGVERFKELYGSGRFESLYRKNLTALVGEWRTVIGSIEVTPRDLQKAAYLFKRSPLFGKECARVIASLNVHTRELIDRKEYRQALSSAERSIALSRSVDAVYQKSILLFRLGEYEQAIDFTRQQFADSTIRSSLLPLHLTLGDSYWGLNEFKKAKFQYSDLLADSLSVSMNEAVALRLQIVSDSAARRALKPYFMEERSDSDRVAFLEGLTLFPKTDVIARYLLGREYSFKRNDSRVVLALRELSPMDSPILEYLRNRRIARAMYNMGNFERAKMYSWRALNYVANEAQLYQLQDFLRRCTWIQEHLQ